MATTSATPALAGPPADFVCSAGDVGVEPLPRPLAELSAACSSLSVRDAACDVWGVVQLGKHFALMSDGLARRWTWRTIQSWCGYAVEHWCRRRRVPMDVDALVRSWVPIVRGLATAHSKDELDRCEFEAEAHLAPLLTAPVRQVREFYAGLCDALREDPTIPFFVTAAFDAWHEVVLKRAPDADVKELKTRLAGEVADLVERDVAPDLRDALVGALQWRSPAALEGIKAAVESGAKPRLKGRESCLFLIAGEACVML